MLKHLSLNTTSGLPFDLLNLPQIFQIVLKHLNHQVEVDLWVSLPPHLHYNIPASNNGVAPTS
jgi:hypothetical protein